jgi:lycopene cyclase domain-containing protein
MMLGRATYLVHLLMWGLPVIGIQIAFLARWYGRALGSLLRVLLVPAFWVTVWLTFADHVAIRAGIWHFGNGLHLGVYLGAVPVEEALFFAITNTLVALGMALFSQRFSSAVAVRA